MIKLKPINPDITLSGYSGQCDAALFEVPGLVIGGKILEGVKVAIPKKSGKGEARNLNILGLNVLEHFKYLLDSTNGKIYFAQNKNYKAYEILKCTNVRTISSNTGMIEVDKDELL